MLPCPCPFHALTKTAFELKTSLLGAAFASECLRQMSLNPTEDGTARPASNP